MEVGIQEIHDCVDDATDKFNMHVTAVTKETGATETDNHVPRHPRFQNVDPEYAAKIMNFVPSSNPYSRSTINTQPDIQSCTATDGNDSSNTATAPSDPTETVTWGKDGPGFQPKPRPPTPQNWYPSPNTHYQSSIDGLPMVQHNVYLGVDGG
jgi:hypothetical protein